MKTTICSGTDFDTVVHNHNLELGPRLLLRRNLVTSGIGKRNSGRDQAPLRPKQTCHRLSEPSSVRREVMNWLSRLLHRVCNTDNNSALLCPMTVAHRKSETSKDAPRKLEYRSGTRKNRLSHEEDVMLKDRPQHRDALISHPRRTEIAAA